MEILEIWVIWEIWFSLEILGNLGYLGNLANFGNSVALCPTLLRTPELVNRDPDFDEVWTQSKRDPNGQFVTLNLQTGERFYLPKL